MRIIAGEHRGRILKSPQGQTTRPTTDRVRESLMSALASARGGFDGAYVLDLFAGSGALSLEALSRGADFACLCEKDAFAIRTIKENLSALRYEKNRARLFRTDSLKGAIFRAASPYDLVFLDPPYALEPKHIFSLIAHLDKETLLASNLLISYEHAVKDGSLVDELACSTGLILASRRSYGDTVIDILTRK